MNKKIQEPEEKEISKAVIGRLPRYFRYLAELKDEGVERISSMELSQLMQVTASQIRQDFNNFGGFGQQGYGYQVEYLYEEIGKLLGLEKEHKLIVIGAGNLGQALANYGNFEKRGFNICAMFERNEALIGKTTVRGIPIYGMDSLIEYVVENQIDIVVMAIPKTSSVEVAESLKDTGIKGIWNFSHTDLDMGKDIVVENVHLSESLMRLSYRISDL